MKVMSRNVRFVHPMFQCFGNRKPSKRQKQLQTSAGKMVSIPLTIKFKKVHRFLGIGTVPTVWELGSYLPRYYPRYILSYSRMYLNLDLIRRLIVKMTCALVSLSDDKNI